MRQARLKAPKHHQVAYYHCVSRVVDRTFRLREQEREMFVGLMRMYEEFGQLRVVTYCVLANHFHVLVEVPRRPQVMPSEQEVLGIVRKAFGRAAAWRLQEELEHFHKIGAHAEAQKIIDGLTARMWDVSAFMKSLKQRFTQWFNKCQKRKGTLWEERFRSTLVEGGGVALAMVAAYVDLNPVRARLVRDPKDYRWCGYAAAVAGVKRAREGIEVAVRAHWEGRKAPYGLLESYRQMMFTWGVKSKVDAEGRTRGAIRQEDYAEVVRSGGKLPVAELLRCRVRYFTDGAVIGSKCFVDAMFKSHRRRFGAGRKDGARKVRGLLKVKDDDAGLYSMRDLRVDVFGPRG